MTVAEAQEERREKDKEMKKKHTLISV